jgi:DNA repair exonuclease SbcCD ATPase subunit
VGAVADGTSELYESIDQVRAQAAALQESLASVRAADDTVTVPGDLLERLDAGIKRARAEIAEMRSRLSAQPDDAELDDADRAGMIALNMALNGAPRAETDRYLEQTFGLPDRERIVEAAYEQVMRLRGV